MNASKIVISFVRIALLSFFSLTKINAQTTITFRLNGNSESKSLIESMLNSIHGISTMTLDTTIKKATVVFNPEEIKEAFSMCTLLRLEWIQRSSEQNKEIATL